MKKRRIKQLVIAKMIIFICLIGVAYSSYKIINWKTNVDDNNKTKKQIDDHITIVKNEETDGEEYKINFEDLKKQNSDVVAYLKINGTNIDYVVVKGKDNNYYLNHNFDKKENVAGWIFADYRNNFDESDKNIIIYGHNTSDGSMFGTLRNTLKNDWQNNKDNLKLTLVTEKENYIYQVFSTYSIVPEEYYITTDFNNDSDYTKFINTIKSRSNHDYNVEVNSSDRILTLSSCTANGKKRVVLHAKLIESKAE